MRFRFDRSLSLHVVFPLTLLYGNRPAIPILMYHSLEHEQQSSVHPYYRTTTPPPLFDEQLRFLQREGYMSCSLEYAVNQLQVQVSSTDKLVVITFDDGYGDFYRHAFGSVGRSSGETLRGKVFHGGAWLGAGMISEQSVRFARNMLLARLLAPSALGTMAIVTSATYMLHSITEIGIREAIIRNPRAAEDEYVRAAWLMSFGRTLAFWALMCLAAPFFAAFYGDPELKPLLIVSALGIIFDGAVSTRAHIAVKNLQFRKCCDQPWPWGQRMRCSHHHRTHVLLSRSLGTGDRIHVGKYRPVHSLLHLLPVSAAAEVVWGRHPGSVESYEENVWRVPAERDLLESRRFRPG